MNNTYEKLKANTCSILQGLTYQTITNSKRQIITNIFIDYVIPLMNCNIDIDFITSYITAILVNIRYSIDLDIEESINIDISQ